eukprot:scaffold14482_cov157-Amphora_coffeaeformis.AAC.2
MARRITALNNNGVHSLQEGHFCEAIFSFRHAIECVTAVVEKSEVDGSSSLDCESLMLSRSLLECLDQRAVHSISPHNIFDVYQCAFFLPRIASITEKSTEISVVLFYNLALAHHLAGLSGREASDEHLDQSLQYYKLAFTVLKSRPDVSFEGYSLVLALLSNLGHVFSHFCKVSEAKSCGEIIDALLESPSVTPLDDEEGDFFYSAATYCSSLSGSLASAA